MFAQSHERREGDEVSDEVAVPVCEAKASDLDIQYAPQSEHAQSEQSSTQDTSGIPSQGDSVQAFPPPGATSPASDDTSDPEKSGEALFQDSSARPVHSVFTTRQKRYIVFMTSFAGFFSPLSANIYFPALNALAADLHVSSSLINLTLTSYMIFQGLAPTFFGDLADTMGRRPVYILGFVIYIAACVGLALQNNYVALFLLRCLQSTGSSGTIALGNGVVADIASSSERGMYMGFASAGPMIGPAVGPVIGGVLSQYLGWPSIFWFLAIMATVYLVPFLITFPETGRNVVGNGSIPPQGWNMSLLNYLQIRRIAKSASSDRPTTSAQPTAPLAPPFHFPNPLKTIQIMLEKDVSLVLFYNALVYTSFYCLAASAPSLFAEIYQLNDLQIGVAFLPFGLGCTLAAFLAGQLMTVNYHRVARRAGLAVDRARSDDMRRFPLERARLQLVWPCLALGAAALVAYGWVLHAEAPLPVPLLLHFVVGLTLTTAFTVLSTLLVDLYPLSPATATAANNLVRCWMGAAGTAVIVDMVRGMGRGWCFTLVGGAVAGCSPVLWVVGRWGARWREERWVRVEEGRRRRKVQEGEERWWEGRR